MKRISLPLLFTLLTLLSGCAWSLGTNWPLMVQIISRRGTYEALKAKPELREEFTAAVAAIDNLLLKPDVDYSEIVAVLQKLSVKELKGDEGTLLIADALDFYDAVTGKKLKLKEGTASKAIVLGILAGIRSGLILTAPPPTPPGAKANEHFRQIYSALPRSWSEASAASRN